MKRHMVQAESKIISYTAKVFYTNRLNAVLFLFNATIPCQTLKQSNIKYSAI